MAGGAIPMKLRPGEKKSLATVGAVVLGTIALSFVIVDRDWHRARAHELAMAGRGTYR
jgi:hypothetical protein